MKTCSSLVLLPTFNEKPNIERIVPRLSALDDEVDVLIIDDASPDGTGELAEELREMYPRLSVLHRREKEGLGPAYLHGFSEALRRGYSRVVTMDADLSHAPEDVPRLLAALDEADVAIGSRHVPGGGVEDCGTRIEKSINFRMEVGITSPFICVLQRPLDRGASPSSSPSSL